MAMVDIDTDDDGVNATAEIVLEDFEVFDIRDVMNVVAYSAMSSGGSTARDFRRKHPSIPPPTFSPSQIFFMTSTNIFS